MNWLRTHSLSFLKQNKSIFWSLLLLLICYAYARLVFLILNPSFMQQEFSQILKVFWVGMRFDLSVIVYTNAWLILLELMPWNKKWYQRIQPFTHLLFILINALFLFLNFIDSIYLKFSGKRSGIDLFYASKDWSGQMAAYFLDYWYIPLLFLPIIYVLNLNKIGSSEIDAAQFENRNKLQFAFRFFLISMLAFLGARGGAGLMPLNAADAAKYTGAKNTALVLNTGFNVLMSVQQQGLETVSYFKEEELAQLYSPIHVLKNSNPNLKNLVVIVLESFGKEYLGKQASGISYTPFLDSLLLLSDNYTHAYANGKRSIEGVPAIVTAMPSWKGIEYINSYYQNNHLDGLGSYLKKYNYNCSFYHGGKNGTMSFDNLISITNSGNYFGLNEYPNPAHFDGNWGIFDHHYLNYWVQELNQKKTPFYSCLFTLSSHHPYTLPNELKGKFTEGTLPIHKSIQYVDFALRHFFEQAAKTNWYKNTVFVVTADHSSENEKPYFQTSQGKFQIPFLVFKPGSKAAAQKISRCVSQLDVLPIALTELQIPDTCFGFGSYPNDSFAVQFQDGYFQLVQYPWVYQFDGKQALGLFNVSADSLQVINLVNTQLPEQNILDKKMKAVIQQYCNRLKNNQTQIH